MPSLSIAIGLVLTLLGVVAFFNPALFGVGKDGPAPEMARTSLTPAAVGIILLLAGLISHMSAGARKHAMHAAAAVSLLGAIGGLVPVVMSEFNIARSAVKVGLGMSILSAIFLALCVNSFIQARKARKAAQQMAG